MSGRWASSERRTQLPPNWEQLRRERKRVAEGQCEADVHARECDGRGSECHHAGDPLDHRLEVLRWVHAECHRLETLQQAAAAKVSRLRPVETPPGLALGGCPLLEALGTGGDSSSARIQVPGFAPSPAPADLEAALAEVSADYAGALEELRARAAGRRGSGR